MRTKKEIIDAQNKAMNERQPSTAPPVRPPTAKKKSVKPLPTISHPLDGLKAPEKSPEDDIKDSINFAFKQAVKGLKGDDASKDESVKSLKSLKMEVTNLLDVSESSNKKLLEKIDELIGVDKKATKVEDSLEEIVDQNKKSSKLQEKIDGHLKDFAKSIHEEGKDHLGTIKDTLLHSFGGFSSLGINLGKAAFASAKSIKDLLKKDDSEKPEAKAKEIKTVEETTPAVPEVKPVAKVEPVEQKEEVKPTKSPEPIIQKPVTPSKVDQPKAVKAVPEMKEPKVWRVAGFDDIYRPPRESKVEEPEIQAKETPAKAPAIEQPKATKVDPIVPAKAAPISREEKRQYKKNQLYSKVEKEAPVDDAPSKKPTRQEKKNQKSKAMTDTILAQRQTAEKVEAPKPNVWRVGGQDSKAEKYEADLDPIKTGIQELVKISENQLKAQEEANLANNSNDLQSVHAKPKEASPVNGPGAPPESSKKEGGGLLDTILKPLLATIIGSVTGGGLLGTLGSIFTDVTETVSKIAKPVSKFAKILEGGGKAIPIIGEVVMVIQGIFDFFSGWSDAAKILDKDGALVTVWDKFSAGIGAMVGGLVSIVDDVLGIFGIQTDIGGFLKTTVAKFLSDIPGMITKYFTDIVADVQATIKAFGTSFGDGIKSLAKLALKALLGSVPGGNLLAKAAGLDLSIPGGATDTPAAAVQPAPKASTTFAPKAEANAATINQGKQDATAPTSQVVAPSTAMQVVNNSSYNTVAMTTRDTEDDHRYGLS